MNEGLIPARYAKAIYEYAAECGQTASLDKVMHTLADSFAAEPQLVRSIANPFIKVDDKKKLLTIAAGLEGAPSKAAGDDAGKKVADLFSRLLAMLAENGRLAFTRDIALAYLDIYRKANRIRLVHVTSAAPLTPEQEKRLKGIIEKQLKGDTMEYTSTVDPDLIGGFTVSIDNERLDASVAGELKQLRRSLLKK